MKNVVAAILLFSAVYSSIVQAYPPKKRRNKPATASLVEPGSPKFLLAGTWTLKAAETILPDGTHVTDAAYGEHAKGTLMIDSDGEYSLQIFRPDRPKFASGDKGNGTPEEYKSSLLGMSTHFGNIKIDTANQLLQFNISYAAYPNWDNTIQTRKFKLSGDELYYEVPPKAKGGTVAVSIWRRSRTK